MVQNKPGCKDEFASFSPLDWNRLCKATNAIVIELNCDRTEILFTKAAKQSNAENLLILKGNKPLVGRYIQNFEMHKAHSEGCTGR